jgi:hypothetical protein
MIRRNDAVRQDYPDQLNAERKLYKRARFGVEIQHRVVKAANLMIKPGFMFLIAAFLMIRPPLWLY